MSASEVSSLRSRLCFALDYPELAAAISGAEAAVESVGVFKVGLELFIKHGPAAIAALGQLGRPLFLDLKLHDIPTTVERAVACAAELGVRYLTVHAAGGPAMLRAARTRIDKEGSPLQLLAVTVLTSMDQADLNAVGVLSPTQEQVARLARLAVDAGAHGLVCSALEAPQLRKLGSQLTLVTPGIRPAGADLHDQHRAQTPAVALKAGADLLVVGRPIRDAVDPASAARAIVAEMSVAAGQQP